IKLLLRRRDLEPPKSSPSLTVVAPPIGKNPSMPSSTLSEIVGQNHSQHRIISEISILFLHNQRESTVHAPATPKPATPSPSHGACRLRKQIILNLPLNPIPLLLRLAFRLIFSLLQIDPPATLPESSSSPAIFTASATSEACDLRRELFLAHATSPEEEIGRTAGPSLVEETSPPSPELLRALLPRRRSSQPPVTAAILRTPHRKTTSATPD
ncbi:hypothetical protein U1Q18_023890, partial [Sarracenia purpurea var. burkii]